MNQTHQRVIVELFVCICIMLSSAPALAAEDWLSSFTTGVTKVLDIIPEWNKAIDKLTTEEERQQFRRRFHRIAKDLRDLESRKQDLIDSLLSSHPDLGIIKDDITDLREAVRELVRNLNRITVSLNLQEAFNGRAVERELDKDLNEKSQYLNKIEQLIRRPRGKIPEADRKIIKERGELAIATIQRAREALRGPLRRLEAER